MAGTYPTPPGHRVPYDADGCAVVGFNKFGGDSYRVYDIAPGPLALMNNEQTGLSVGSPYPSFASGNGANGDFIVCIFPELREVDGFSTAQTNAALDRVGICEWSPDTTNGFDGTWNTAIANYPDPTPPATNLWWRTTIQSLAIVNARAFRSYRNGDNAVLYYWHLYGEISPGQTPDRLLILDDATGLEFGTDYDVGEVPRGGSADKGIRFRNNSATLTATTTQYTRESLYLDSEDWYLFTEPGGSVFSSVQAIASLAPATTTGLITLRRIIPGTEPLGLRAARIYTNTGSWV